MRAGSAVYRPRPELGLVRGGTGCWEVAQTVAIPATCGPMSPMPSTSNRQASTALNPPACMSGIGSLSK